MRELVIEAVMIVIIASVFGGLHYISRSGSKRCPNPITSQQKTPQHIEQERSASIREDERLARGVSAKWLLAQACFLWIAPIRFIVV